MDITEIPLFAMLKSRMGYLTERQRVIAQNVANADTPNYLPQDLKPYSFQSHMAAAAASQPPRPQLVRQPEGAGLAIGAGAAASAATAASTTCSSPWSSPTIR